MERPTSQPGGFFMEEKIVWPFDIENWIQEKLEKENQESGEEHAL